MDESLVVICIPTTPERRNRLLKCIESIHAFAGYPCAIMTYENNYQGYVKSIHKILECLSPNTLVWCIGDDIVLREPDTVKRLVQEYKVLYPRLDGVVNPNDGIQCGALCTVPFTTAGIMRDNTPKDFFHNYADNVFTDSMKAAGKYTYLPHITVIHEHWCNELAHKDATYTIALQMMEHDADLYRARKSYKSP